MEKNNLLSEEERRFIKELLKESRPQYKEAFLKIANSDDKDDRELFMKLHTELAKILNKNVPIDEYWTLRSGDLKPEKVKDLGFSLDFCCDLSKTGLLFESKAEAELASIKALQAASELLRKDKGEG